MQKTDGPCRAQRYVLRLRLAIVLFLSACSDLDVRPVRDAKTEDVEVPKSPDVDSSTSARARHAVIDSMPSDDEIDAALRISSLEPDSQALRRAAAAIVESLGASATIKRVAIVAGDGASDPLAVLAANIFEVAIANGSRVILLDRERVAVLTEEIRRSQSGPYDPMTAKELGRRLAADALFGFDVTRSNGEAYIHTWLLQTETGTVMFSSELLPLPDMADRMSELKRILESQRQGVRFWTDVKKRGSTHDEFADNAIREHQDQVRECLKRIARMCGHNAQ